MVWVRAPESAIRLKVTLKGLRPPVWRRLLVENTTSLGDLHVAVQAAMGWDDSHLHLFMVGREQYSDPSTLDEVEDEAGVTVGALAGAGVKSFAYIYDMGDSWEHTIAIEGSEAIDGARAYPACLGGKRACPPEDSGGAWGFAEMLEAIADPGAFSVEATDARLGTWFRRRKPRPGRKGGPRGSG